MSTTLSVIEMPHTYHELNNIIRIRDYTWGATSENVRIVLGKCTWDAALWKSFFVNEPFTFP